MAVPRQQRGTANRFSVVNHIVWVKNRIIRGGLLDSWSCRREFRIFPRKPRSKHLALIRIPFVLATAPGCVHRGRGFIPIAEDFVSRRHLMQERVNLPESPLVIIRRVFSVHPGVKSNASFTSTRCGKRFSYVSQSKSRDL